MRANVCWSPPRTFGGGSGGAGPRARAGTVCAADPVALALNLAALNARDPLRAFRGSSSVTVWSSIPIPSPPGIASTSKCRSSFAVASGTASVTSSRSCCASRAPVFARSISSNFSFRSSTSDGIVVEGSAHERVKVALRQPRQRGRQLLRRVGFDPRRRGVHLRHDRLRVLLFRLPRALELGRRLRLHDPLRLADSASCNPSAISAADSNWLRPAESRRTPRCWRGLGRPGAPRRDTRAPREAPT